MPSVRSDTPLPTPTDWALAGELRPKDYVFAHDGRPTRVVSIGHEVPSAALEIKMVMDPVTVSVDHDAVLGLPWYGKWIGPPELLAERERRLHEPLATTKRVVLELPDNLELPLDPWAYGYWRILALPEGTIAVSENLAKIAKAHLASIGLPVKRTFRDRGLAYLTSPGIEAGLEKVGHWPAFHPDYLRAGASQRWAMLAGIMDARGRFMGGVTVEAARPIMEAAADLAMSLGLRASTPNKGLPRLRMSPYDAPMVLRAAELEAHLTGPNRPGYRTEVPYMIRKAQAAATGDFVTIRTEAGTYLLSRAMLPVRDH